MPVLTLSVCEKGLIEVRLTRPTAAGPLMGTFYDTYDGRFTTLSQWLVRSSTMAPNKSLLVHKNTDTSLSPSTKDFNVPIGPMMTNAIQLATTKTTAAARTAKLWRCVVWWRDRGVLGECCSGILHFTVYNGFFACSCLRLGEGSRSLQLSVNAFVSYFWKLRRQKDQKKKKFSKLKHGQI